MVTGITCVLVNIIQNDNYLQTTKPFYFVKIRYALLNCKRDEKERRSAKNESYTTGDSNKDLFQCAYANEIFIDQLLHKNQ